MPLLEGRMLVQTILVFAMIGLLGLVLRWTFKRDKGSPDWPEPSSPWISPELSGRAAHPVSLSMGGGDPETGPEPEKIHNPAGPHGPVTVDEDGEDFGLLAEAARVESGDEAERIKDVLAHAGIRATTTPTRDGRIRVLVFASEVHRARRVANGPTT